MKTLHWILLGILCLVVSSCGSDDEPEVPYTGPWMVEYFEEYSYTHNNSPEFIKWFNDHIGCFVRCNFRKGNSMFEFTDYVELDDYKNYPVGNIEWIEIVDNATEDEIRSKVKRFQDFTIKDPNNRFEFDIFEADYQRYDGK